MSGNWWRQHGGLLVACAAVLYHLVEPTHGIKWGDGLEFTAVSSHLGVAHPPGYPLFTLLGWLALKLPFAEPYQAMLLICRLAMAAIILGLFVLLKRLLLGLRAGELVAGLLAAAFSFSLSLWPTVHLVEVYSLSTALLLWSIITLASPSPTPRCLCPRSLSVGFLLAGLAIANHLTSLAILPVLLLSVARSWKSSHSRWLLLLPAALLVIVPLALYASLMMRMPDDSRAHGIYWGAPFTLSNWFSHVRGGEYGVYQFLSIQPGVPFTLSTWISFAISRVLLILSAIGGLFFGPGLASFFAGILLCAAGIGGAVAALRDRMLRPECAAILAVIALQVGFIFLYSIPDINDYLLPPMTLFFPFIVLGLRRMVEALFRKAQPSPAELEWRTGRVLTFTGAGLLAVAFLTVGRAVPPVAAPFAEAWRERLFAALPEGAGIITATDADLYTIWYEQFARGERLDVVAYGANFSRFPWFRMTMPPDDPRRAAVQFVEGPPPLTLQDFIRTLSDIAVEPMLREGRPLFIMFRHPMEGQELARRYNLTEAAELLTDKEMQLILNEGEVNVPPPVLYRISPKQ